MKSPFGRLEYIAPHYQDRVANLILQEKPSLVIETGLETGVGAEHILEALDKNDHGRLISIDPVIHWQFSGNPIVHPRFTFINKMSQDALPTITEPADFFIHDSDHDAECQQFEYDWAWWHVKPGGLIITDDPYWGTPCHWTWTNFLKSHSMENQAVVIGNAQYIRRP